MKRYRAYLAALVGLGLLLVVAVGGAAPAAADPPTILEFQSMAPVTGPFVGSANPERGLNGGGLPWMLDRAQGELHADGKLEVRVQGLVLANDPAVPANQRGTNPIPSFRAIVSCLVAQGSSVAPVNVATDPSPATTKGNAHIEATVALPPHCVAPEVFVTSPANAWFAVTGR
ncbi:MAG: hypothetical protein LBJ87_15215 [bacterium]|jgi:hypothetical protein|nr:hypothetical protein [bacterium]